MQYRRTNKLYGSKALVCNRRNVVPGHALHEKSLQGQIGDGPLVSSKERSAVVVDPAGQADALFFHSWTSLG